MFAEHTYHAVNELVDSTYRKEFPRRTLTWHLPEVLPISTPMAAITKGLNMGDSF